MNNMNNTNNTNNNNNNFKINLLKLNSSDYFDVTEFNLYKKNNLNVNYTGLSRYTNFFFNLKNITYEELRSFLINIGVDVNFVLNNIFIKKNFLYFFSLFPNEALLLYFFLQIEPIELCYLFGNFFINKLQILTIVNSFFKRVNFEIYRFYCSSILKYIKNVKIFNYMEFKAFIINKVFLFDDRDGLYKYYWYICLKQFGNNINKLFYYIYEMIFDEVYLFKFSLIDIFNYLIDQLVSNLWNYFYLKIDFFYTKNIFLNFYDFLFEKNKNFYINYNLKKGMIMSWFLNDLVVFHEFFCFFRYFIFFFKKIFFFYLRSSRLSFFKFFIFYFKKKFFLLKNFFKNILSKNNIFDFYLNVLYRFLIVVFYKFFFLKKKSFIYIYFFFNKIWLRLVNFFFFSQFYKKIISIDYSFIGNNDNALFFNFFSFFSFKKFKLLDGNEFFFLGNYKNFFSKNFYIKNHVNVLKKIIYLSTFNFFFKKNLYYYYYNSYFINFFFKKSYIFKFNSFFKFLNLNTRYFFFFKDFLDVKKPGFIDTNWLLYLYNDFLVNIGDFIFSKFELILFYMKYTVIRRIFFFEFNIRNLTYKYMPMFLKNKILMEDLFFLRIGDFFAEDFNMFLSDILLEEKYETIDSEDVGDFMDDFFEKVFLYDLPFFFILSDLSSVNYYVTENYTYKYMDYMLPSFQYINNDISYKYNLFLFNNKYERSVIRNFLRNKNLEGYVDISNFSGLFDISAWYNWVMYLLLSELQVFRPNYYRRQMEFKPFNFRFLNYIFFGSGVYGYKFSENDDDVLENHEVWFYKKKSQVFDEVNLEYFADSRNVLNVSDDNLYSYYNNFNFFFKRLFYTVYNYDLSDEEFKIDMLCMSDITFYYETWIWWELINKIYKKSFLEKFELNFFSFEDYLFLNTFILSGLYIFINKILKVDKLQAFYKEKGLDFSKDIVFDIINSYIDVEQGLYQSKDILSQLIKNLENTTDILIHDSIKDNFEVYYNNWFCKYDYFFFKINYYELSYFIFEFSRESFEIDLLFLEKNKIVDDEAYVFKEDGSNSSLSIYLYNFLKKKEIQYLQLYVNCFYSYIYSFYKNYNLNMVNFFFESLFFILIELGYLIIDRDINYEITETKYFKNNLSNMFSPEKYRNIFSYLKDLHFIDNVYNYNYEIYNDTFLFILEDYLIKMFNDDIFYNFNFMYTISEAVFFDFYQNYLDLFFDNNQDSFDYINDLRIYEDDFFLIRNNTKEDESYKEQYDSIEDTFGYFNNETFSAFKSLDFNNFFFSESYLTYYKRVNSIKFYNYFLFGVFNKFINRYFILAEIVKKLQVFDGFDFVKKNDINYYFFDLNLLKKNLIQFFFNKMYYLFFSKKIKSFKKFLLYMLIYTYICDFYLKSQTYSYNYYFFFFKFFFSFFSYIILCFLKKKGIKIFLIKDCYNLICNLSFLEFYEFIVFFNKKVLRFFFFLYKSIKTFFFKKKFFTIYSNLIYIFFDKNIFYGSYLLLFDFGLKQKTDEIFFFNKYIREVKKLNVNIGEYFVLNKYEFNCSFRSFSSLLNIYKTLSNDNKYSLSLDNFFKYYQDFNTSKNLLVINTKLGNIGNNNFFKTNDFLIGLKDMEFLDMYDVFKNVIYHNMVDDQTIQDEDYYEDEWSTYFMIGDLSDLFEDEEMDGDIDEEMSLENFEEFNYELLLDQSLFYQYEQNLSHFYNIYDFYLFGYRYKFFFNKLFYLNLFYIRAFLLKFVKFYKNYVKIGYQNYDKMLYGLYMPLENISEYDSESRSKYTSNTMNVTKNLGLRTRFYSVFFKNFSRLSKVFLKKGNYNFIKKNDNYVNFDGLIPKYAFSYEFDFIIDYFLNFNDYKITNLSINFINNFFFNSNNRINSYKNFYLLNEFYKFINFSLKFLSFFFLHLFIYNYINKQLNRVIFYFFFFFELKFLFFKNYCFFLKKSNNFYIDTSFFKKILFDKIYMFLIRKLQKVILKKNVFFKNITSNTNENFFIKKFLIKKNFFFSNTEILIKKFFLLKNFFKNTLSLYGYFLFIKIIEWFNYLFIDFFDKSIFYKFFFFLKKRIILLEVLIFKNSYKLAQIYSKYGVIESVFYFEKLLSLTKFQKFDSFVEFTSYFFFIRSIFILYEIIVFFFFIILMFFFIVDLSYYNLPGYFSHFVLFNFFAKLEYLEFSPIRNIVNYQYLFENKLYFMLNFYWFDLWGIF